MHKNTCTNNHTFDIKYIHFYLYFSLLIKWEVIWDLLLQESSKKVNTMITSKNLMHENFIFSYYWSVLVTYKFHNAQTYVASYWGMAWVALSGSLWECKSKSWEMKARLDTQRTPWPQQGRNRGWFKSNGLRPARSQAWIRDTGLISPR